MIKLFFQMQESPIILRDGNGTIYPMAKDCMGGIRDPDWLDLPPISSLGMGVHSLTNLPANSTIKKKAAIIIMAVEVKYFLQYLNDVLFSLGFIKLCLKQLHVQLFICIFTIQKLISTKDSLGNMKARTNLCN